MTETKVNLYITIPGGKLYDKQLCFKNSQVRNKHGKIVNVEEAIPDMTIRETFYLDEVDKRTGKVSHNLYTYHLRKCAPAKQVIHLSKDAYLAMTNEEEVPHWFRRIAPKATVYVWKNLSSEQRLALHLDAIAEDLGGVVESYQILED